jgi:hypothetical protein
VVVTWVLRSHLVEDQQQRTRRHWQPVAAIGHSMWRGARRWRGRREGSKNGLRAPHAKCPNFFWPNTPNKKIE